jgi:hypothetical protein
MTRNCGIRCAAKRLTLAVLAAGALAGFWSASAFAESALGTSTGSLVGDGTQMVGQSTALAVAAAAGDAAATTNVVTTASSTATTATSTAATPTATAVVGSAGNAVTTTTAATTNAVGSTWTTATTGVVQPVVDTVAGTVDAASESVSSTPQGTVDSVTSLTGGALSPKLQSLVTTVGTTAASMPHSLAGGSSTVATRSDEQPVGAVEEIAPALDSPVPSAVPRRAVSAPQSWVYVNSGSRTTRGRAQRAHVTPSGVPNLAIFTGAGKLTLPPARHAASAKQGGSLPRIPDIPAGLLAGASATGASGGSTGLVAALIAALLLAVPRVGRWLRPAVATRPLLIPQLSLERPG